MSISSVFQVPSLLNPLLAGEEGTSLLVAIVSSAVATDDWCRLLIVCIRTVARGRMTGRMVDCRGHGTRFDKLWRTAALGNMKEKEEDKQSPRTLTFLFVQLHHLPLYIINH